MKRKMISKILCSILILIFIFPSYLSISNSQVYNNFNESEEILNTQKSVGYKVGYYGIIIPIASSKEIMQNPESYNETLNLVNDLLRNNIEVYCNQNPLEIRVTDLLDSNIICQRMFEQGSFIIPFSGNEFKDTLKIIILHNYIFSQKNKIIFHFLTEPISSITLIELRQPRIAYYFDEGVTIECLEWYIFPLYKAGFLDNEILSDLDIINNLTNKNYNVLIWPGGRLMEGFHKNLSISSRLNRQAMIKNFVSNGGGYVGSCYGAFVSSSGMRFTPFLLAQYYTKKFPSFGFLSLSDALLAIGIPSNINITIKDSNNPVLFGLNDTIPGSILRGGPVYTWVGGNSEELASIESIDTSWLHFIDSMDNQFLKKLLNRWVNFTIGKTVWISSKYNDGKIVTFGDHPEQGNILLKRAVHNAVLFVSSKTVIYAKEPISYSIIWVKTIIDNCNDLTIDSNNESNLIEMSRDISYIYEKLEEIEERYDRIFERIHKLYESHKIDGSFYYELRSSALWEFKDFLSSSKQFLKDKNESEDTLDNLKTITTYYQLLSIENELIEHKFIQFQDNMTQRIYKIKNSIHLFYENQNNLLSELRQYKNTSEQDNKILNLMDSLNIHAKIFVKNIPLLNFESSVIARDFRYQYLTNICMK
jgi:hypothetical protein